MAATIGIIAMGEMGAGVGARLIQRGARVLTSLAGRSGASADRASRAGIEAVDDATLAGEAEIVLSIVPPDRAAALAERLLPAMVAAPRRPVYVDCNAIAPETMQAIAKPLRAAGLPVVDVGIIGAPPKSEGPGPRFYASGETARIEALRTHGLDVRRVSDALGDASGLKMAYAGITKGFQALGAAMAVGAARAGIAEALSAELRASQPELYGWLAGQLPRMYAKAYRWLGEMEEIARFLQPEQGGAQMLEGAAVLYREIARDWSEGKQAGRIALLEEFCRGA